MQYFVVALAALAGSAVAAPAAAASSCPQSYPGEVTDTPDSAFYLTIDSSNPLTNGHNVQLRPVSGSNTTKIVVVDNSSPVLLSTLTGEFLYSEYRDDENQLHADGLVGAYCNVTATNSDALQDFYFDEFPAQDPPPKTWYFLAPSSTALYNLYHEVDIGVTNGFLLCEKDDYYQVMYSVSTASEPADYPGCEPVALQSTIAPKLGE